ncbi:MATE family efflux transporter [Anaeromicropila populeti]|nr:MATE family efflux transporter [Anaeromicropila populeti]
MKTEDLREPKLSMEEEIERGPIVPTSIKLAMPIIIGQLLLLLYSIGDTWYVSLLDKNSTTLITGVGLVAPIYMLFIALGTGVCTGVSSLVARSVGEKNEKIYTKIANSGLFFTVILGIISIVLLYIFANPILHFLAGTSISEETINNGLKYMRFLIPGLGATLIYECLLGILQGQGLNKYYGITMILSTLINAIFDPIFIFVFKLGVGGAALGTALSVILSACLVFFVFIPQNSTIKISRNVSPDSKITWEILRIGIPHALSMIGLSVMLMFLNNLVGSISEVAMNSWSLVGRMDEMILLVGYGFGGATMTLVGQNFGSKNKERINESYRTNVVLGIIYGIIFAVVYNLVAKYLFSIFTGNKDVLDGCLYQVRIVSFTYLGVIVAIVSTSAFQATGRALPGLILDIIRMGVITIPVSYLMIYVFHQEVSSIFVVIAASNLLTGLISFLWCIRSMKNVKFKKAIS